MRSSIIATLLFLTTTVVFAAAPAADKAPNWNQKKVQETCDAQVVVAQNLLAVTKEDSASMRTACIKSFGNAKSSTPAPTPPAPKK